MPNCKARAILTSRPYVRLTRNVLAVKHRNSLLLIALWIVAEACAASKSSDEQTADRHACVGPKCQTGGQTKDDFEISLATGGGGSSGTAASFAGSSLPTLCGAETPSCDPDDTLSCHDAAVALGQGGSSGAASLGDFGSGTRGISESGAGAPGNSVVSAGTVGDSIGGSGATDSGMTTAGTSATVPSGNAAGSVATACRIRRDLSVVRATCEVAGKGTIGAPCASRANCAAGLACVDENGTAQCRPYCCRGVGSCPPATYCDLRPTHELVASTEPLLVSVCMPGTDCRFEDPNKCQVDRSCSCPSSKVCGVVRSDGTTACVTPGTGTEGEPCPCAAQHVCSDARGTCFQICSLATNELQCASGICQASTSMPDNWGVCVNSAALL
jgi:hypothetical protein